VRADDFPAKVEPQPRPLGRFRGFIRTIKAVKNVRQVAWVNTRTAVTDADDHIFLPRFCADAYFSARAVLDGVVQKVGEHLSDSFFIRRNHGEIRGKFHHKTVLLRLGGVTVRQKTRQPWDFQFSLFQAQAAGLQTGRVQQVFDHFGQVIGLILNNGQALRDNLAVPLYVIPPQRADVTFNQRDGGLQLVADHGNETGLHLFSSAEARNIPDGGNDVNQCFVG